MKISLIIFLVCFSFHHAAAQVVEWPAGQGRVGRLVLSMQNDSAFFHSIAVVKKGISRVVVRDVDPAFFLRVGKRDLVSQNGWNIFFDKVPDKPFSSFPVRMEKKHFSVVRAGARTVIAVDGMHAPGFTGKLEVTLYHGSLLMNIAAVMTTLQDSTAILYDAGLVCKRAVWDSVGWFDVEDRWKGDSFRGNGFNPEAVKYRAIAGKMGSGQGSAGRGSGATGSAGNGSMVIFPAPHQYFYPLDEAFNLRFVWWGRYDSMSSGYGVGIRQEPAGDHRYVPWFNAPPGTAQRLNFFCLPGDGDLAETLDSVKAYTRGDHYKPLPGYRTFSSHFHNEFISKVVLAGKDVPAEPAFIKYFKEAGIDIVHLAEFHGVGHPKGPDEQRLRELDALFAQCRRLSDEKLLLLPGEEPNEFFGGHWLAFFPHPVYWIMSHKPGDAFVSSDSIRGKVYRVGNAGEMLDLLNREQGLAWTAHPRTKGSTGYPDTYKEQNFFLSERWLGGAWKALPADLSQPRLGKRAFDLLDDMNNWGLDKRILSEADLFTINQANEMYAHMNVNYLHFGALPAFDKGWGGVLDSLRKGRFFSTTGEVLIPFFTVDGRMPGDTVVLKPGRLCEVAFSIEWTFPLDFAELVSGDGVKVYRQVIPLDNTSGFGHKTFRVPIELAHRKWIRLAVWDVAADGAFTQTVQVL